jgi:hypothetical protein
MRGAVRNSSIFTVRDFPQFERAQTEFLGDISRILRNVRDRRGFDQGKRRIRELLPDREIFWRDCKPAESQHVPAGLCHSPGQLPCDLIDAQLLALTEITAEAGAGYFRSNISINGDRRRRTCAGGQSRRFLNHRQLQHGGTLPLTELRYQHAAAIRKFDRIMVTMRNLWFYRSEFSDAKVDGFGPDPSIVVFDVFGERQFRAGKHADRYGGIIFRREATCGGSAECSGNQRLSDLGGARRYSVQTIVTHRIAPRLR